METSQNEFGEFLYLKGLPTFQVLFRPVKDQEKLHSERNQTDL